MNFVSKYLQQRAPQVPMSPAQGMATQQQMPQAGMQVPNSPMGPQGDQMDPALAAMLGIEALSPQQESLKRKQAQIDELRNFALSGGARHWTGALAQGLAGFGSGNRQRKLDPEYERVGKERREKMEQMGRDLFGRRSY